MWSDNQTISVVVDLTVNCLKAAMMRVLRACLSVPTQACTGLAYIADEHDVRVVSRSNPTGQMTLIPSRALCLAALARRSAKAATGRPAKQHVMPNGDVMAAARDELGSYARSCVEPAGLLADVL